MYETDFVIVHTLYLSDVSLEDLEERLDGLLANPTPECSDQLVDTSFDLQCTGTQLVRQIIPSSRVSLPRLELLPSVLVSHHAPRNGGTAPRGLGGGTPASTEQSDSRGQEGDTCLNQQTTELVCADQKYLR